ncbi:MAG: alpha/beta hydrolase [Rhodospirillaceae bacterium]|nr:MAG: alpha/beta hydrolase [Rhodospirillaceae bacterium]
MTEPHQEKTGRFIPARVIPVPRTVSPEAQAYLSTPAPIDRPPEPEPKDKAAWRAMIKNAEQAFSAMTAARAEGHPCDVVTHELSATQLYEVTPRSMTARNENRAILHIHGGAFIMGGGRTAAHTAMPIADRAKIRTFSVDYRMPPDHPFPAGLNDAVEAYRMLLTRFKPANIAVYGESAGGGLAASFVLKARDMGLPIPGACVLHSPEADLTESGDTFETNDKVDSLLSRLTNSIALYADGHDLRDPYLSPIFGDFSKGFSPTILTSGTRDLFLSNAAILHRALRRAGIKAEINVFEAMPHGGFLNTAPEDREVLTEHIRFMDEHLGA